MYKLFEAKDNIHAVDDSGAIVTFNRARLMKIPAERIASYIDAEVRKARAEYRLAEMGVTEFSS